MGGALVGPWDVLEMPEEWAEALQTFVAEFPAMKNGMKQVEDVFAKWRAKHPTYRK